MKTILVFFFAFFFGVIFGGVRMTDDKTNTERLKVKRVSDGIIRFVPKDDDFPYAVGDIYEGTRNMDIGVMVEKWVVVDDIKK